eukprot:7807586-Pyramimonas_sp.AAC.1
MGPSDIGGSRFVSELRAALVAPKTPTRYPAGPPSTFDVFVVSGGPQQGHRQDRDAFGHGALAP